jgi:hypothetical protein
MGTNQREETAAIMDRTCQCLPSKARGNPRLVAGRGTTHVIYAYCTIMSSKYFSIVLIISDISNLEMEPW